MYGKLHYPQNPVSENYYIENVSFLNAILYSFTRHSFSKGMCMGQMFELFSWYIFISDTFSHLTSTSHNRFIIESSTFSCFLPLSERLHFQYTSLS
jgi:hypothetical protein